MPRCCAEILKSDGTVRVYTEVYSDDAATGQAQAAQAAQAAFTAMWPGEAVPQPSTFTKEGPITSDHARQM